MHITKDLKQSMFRQWVQNLVIFAGLIFAHRWNDESSILRTVFAFLAFCFFTYALTLVVHILKQNSCRIDEIPAALAGALPGWFGYALLGFIAVSAFVSLPFAAVLLVYFIIAVAHDLFFYKQVILDVVIVSFEFTLKAIGGVVVLKNVEVSPWLVVCAFLLSLVVCLGKRRNELWVYASIPDNNRARMTGYTTKLLDQMMAVATSSTLIAYTLYTISERTQLVVGSTNLVYTVPFVLYGILRYLFLVHRKELVEGSEIAILKDLPMMLNIGLYLTGVLIILLC